MLYILVRDDLSPGYQLAQSVHAGIGFALAYPPLASWHQTLVCLQAPLFDLEDICLQAILDGDRFTAFFEPDLGDALTAVALVPHSALERRLRSLPLVGGGESNGT